MVARLPLPRAPPRWPTPRVPQVPTDWGGLAMSGISLAGIFGGGYFASQGIGQVGTILANPLTLGALGLLTVVVLKK